MKVSLMLVNAIFDGMAGRVRYKLGAKAPPGRPPGDVERLDCSGFVRYALIRAGGPAGFPDGSVNQRQWCEQHLRRLRAYEDLRHAAQDPSRLFIAFIAPGALGPGKAGHVWLVCGGRSLESSAAFRPSGVGSRRWNSPTLLRASAAYEVPVE